MIKRVIATLVTRSNAVVKNVVSSSLESAEQSRAERLVAIFRQVKPKKPKSTIGSTLVSFFLPVLFMITIPRKLSCFLMRSDPVYHLMYSWGAVQCSMSSCCAVSPCQCAVHCTHPCPSTRNPPPTTHHSTKPKPPQNPKNKATFQTNKVRTVDGVISTSERQHDLKLIDSIMEGESCDQGSVIERPTSFSRRFPAELKRRLLGLSFAPGN